MDSSSASRDSEKDHYQAAIKVDESKADVAAQLSTGYGETISDEDALRIRSVSGRLRGRMHIHDNSQCPAGRNWTGTSCHLCAVSYSSL